MTHVRARKRITGRRSYGFVFALLMAIAAAFAVAAFVTDAAVGSSTGPAPPSITVDKLDYAPGESVSIFGKDWGAGETVTLSVGGDGAMTSIHVAQVTASTDGTFEHAFSLPEFFVASYTVTATGSSGSVASTQFTDLIYRMQYSTNSNGTGTPGSSQLTISAPAVGPGDVLIAQVVANGFSASEAICAPPGWTQILRSDAASGQLVVETFLRVVTQASGNESHTWQFKTTSGACGSTGSESSVGASGGIIRYTGVDTAHPLDVAPLGASGLGTTATAPRLYTVTDRTKILRFFGASKSPASGIDFPAGRIYQVGSNTTAERTAASYDGPLTPAGSTNIFPAAMGAEAQWAAQSIALRMAAAPTSMSGVSGSATYGGTATLTATLSSDAAALGGKTVTFTLNGVSVGSGVTDPAGVATLSGVGVETLGAGAYPAAVGAAFAGDANYVTSNNSGTLTIAQAATTTAVTCPTSVTHTGVPVEPCAATVTGPLGLSETVAIVYAGNLDIGTATATATYAGSANYLGSSDVKTFSIVCGISAAFDLPIKDDVRNVVKFGNVVPVKLRLTQCDGIAVTGRTLSIRLVVGLVTGDGIPDESEFIPTSVGNADTTGIMRFVDGRYVYNLSTKGLGPSLVYTVVVRDTTRVEWSSAPTLATAVIEARR